MAITNDYSVDHSADGTVITTGHGRTVITVNTIEGGGTASTAMGPGDQPPGGHDAQHPLPPARPPDSTGVASHRPERPEPAQSLTRADLDQALDQHVIERTRTQTIYRDGISPWWLLLIPVAAVIGCLVCSWISSDDEPEPAAFVGIQPIHAQIADPTVHHEELDGTCQPVFVFDGGQHGGNIEVLRHDYFGEEDRVTAANEWIDPWQEETIFGRPFQAGDRYTVTFVGNGFPVTYGPLLASALPGFDMFCGDQETFGASILDVPDSVNVDGTISLLIDPGAGLHLDLDGYNGETRNHRLQETFEDIEYNQCTAAFLRKRGLDIPDRNGDDIGDGELIRWEDIIMNPDCVEPAGNDSADDEDLQSPTVSNVDFVCSPDNHTGGMAKIDRSDAFSVDFDWEGHIHHTELGINGLDFPAHDYTASLEDNVWVFHDTAALPTGTYNFTVTAQVRMDAQYDERRCHGALVVS